MMSYAFLSRGPSHLLLHQSKCYELKPRFWPQSLSRNCQWQATKDNSSLISQYKASGSWSVDQITSVSSWQFLLACFGLAAASLWSFNILTGSIQALSAQTSADITIFDIRNGYTPEEVSSALRAWGLPGKSRYTVIEIIDITFYATGYRGVAMVIFNKLSSGIGKEIGRDHLPIPVAVFPAALAQLDRLEDFLQLLATWTFDERWPVAPELWQNLVTASSTVNITKWFMVQAGSVGVLGFLLTLGSLKALPLLARKSQG